VTHINTRLVLPAACCFFILAGLAVIPYVGLQNDEALFANPLYLFNAKDFCINIGHRQIPLMVMSYIGTLKTLFYAPIFFIFGSGVWSVRVPMLLCGCATIFFFFNLVQRVVNERTAVIAAVLLATDPSFLLTGTIDWGPVAMGHFVVVTGCLCLVRFAQIKRNPMRDLALGFFLLGLGLWNKALFLWVLAGIGIGAALIFRRELHSLVTWRRAAVATLEATHWVLTDQAPPDGVGEDSPEWHEDVPHCPAGKAAGLKVCDEVCDCVFVDLVHVERAESRCEMSTERGRVQLVGARS